MDEYYFKIRNIDQKREENEKMSSRLRCVVVLLMFSVSFCTLMNPQTMKITWYILLFVIWLMFILDVYYVEQNKKLEYKLYEIKKEELDRKKRIATITLECLSDEILNQKIEEPAREVSLPLVFYIFMTIIAIVAIIIMETMF